MDIKIIKTENEYELALAEIECLMDAEPCSSEEDKLEVLSLLVEKYEEENYPIQMPDPISAIKFRMEQQGLRQKDLIPFIGSQPQVSAVLNGKRELSKEMVRRLHKGLGIPYEVLMQSPDAQYQAQKYNVADYPFNEMVHKGYFPGYEDVRTAKRRGERLLEAFFDVFRDQLPTPIHCKHSQKEVDGNALLAWQAHILNNLAEEEIPKYHSSNLDDRFLLDLLHFSAYESGVLLVKEHLNKIGVYFMIADHLPKTYLDGASFVSPDGAPVIALTLRHDRLDNFWFTLFHELGHVKLHLEKNPEQAFFDDTSNEHHENCNAYEEEANQFAWEKMIPNKCWQEEITPKLGDIDSKDIEYYAEQIQINPAIIAGRIRYQTNNYSIFTSLIGHRKVRQQFHQAQVAS